MIMDEDYECKVNVQEKMNKVVFFWVVNIKIEAHPRPGQSEIWCPVCFVLDSFLLFENLGFSSQVSSISSWSL